MDVPLPLAGPPGARIMGVHSSDGALVQVPTPPRLQQAVEALGLGHALGYLRLLQVCQVQTFKHCLRNPSRLPVFAKLKRMGAHQAWPCNMFSCAFRGRLCQQAAWG